jgi:hypothetical protein
MTPQQSIRAATRAADVVAGDWLAGYCVLASYCVAHGRDRAARNPGGRECDRCGCVFIGEEWHHLCAACLRATWRRYTRATSRLRLCTDATPRSIQRARFARVLELELAIMRETHLPMRAVFDAAEEASDRVLHRARRWAA